MFLGAATTLQQKQMMWEAARDRYCKNEAGAGAPGGSTNDAIYMACHTAYTREGIAQLKTVTGCDRIPSAPTCEIGPLAHHIEAVRGCHRD